MNRLFLSLISLAACMSSCTSPEPLTDYVDPRIGTAHSRWFFFTPAAVPFGMAKLAPTTEVGQLQEHADGLHRGTGLLDERDGGGGGPSGGQDVVDHEDA